VLNLLSNAVKYTPEGGVIRYRVSESMLPDNRMAMHVEVVDNGIGMSQEFQTILFDSFTQEHHEYQTERRGSGLGLAITKKLVEAMGGTISVKSSLGQGSTFSIDFELACVPSIIGLQDRTEISDSDDLTFIGKHVLLCEDHPLNQEIAKAVLEEKGFVVTIAENGLAGTQIFEKSPIGYFDCILMDIHMPVMEGYEATKTIRAMERADAQAIPIIAITADAFDEDVQKCLDAGMNGHIAKPIEPTKLCKVVADFLR
jgi:CheY-like chemotaxis protein